MARDHARFQTSIWKTDPDWPKLDVAAQHAYFMLTSHPDITYCGALDYLPGRWVGLASGLTVPKLRTPIRTLERGRYVVIDRGTQELVVRSFIRHDKILARRNMGHACGRALGELHSDALRGVILHELARLWLEDSSRDGWLGFKDYDPMAWDMVCAEASAMERAMP